MKQMVFNPSTFVSAFAFCGTALVATSAIADVHNSPLPPQYLARIQDYNTQFSSAKANLQAKNYVQAEEGFRAAIADDWGDAPYIGLAETLVAEGRTVEALQAYHVYFHPVVGSFQGGGTVDPKVNLEYALLLNQTGEWTEAVDHYNAALPDLVKWDYKANLHFDAAAPQPAALAAAAHIGLGLYDNFEYEPDSNTKAMQEYKAALQLAPDWDAANYYYGYGWQKLSPAERTQFGTMQQAKAHLQKAEKVGNASVRAAAAKVLKALG
jgi:tetratricopeptide (TPR) repeat protein